MSAVSEGLLQILKSRSLLSFLEPPNHWNTADSRAVRLLSKLYNTEVKVQNTAKALAMLHKAEREIIERRRREQTINEASDRVANTPFPPGQTISDNDPTRESSSPPPQATASAVAMQPA